MEDVTDTVFRELIAGTSNPGNLHVLFTEFFKKDRKPRHYSDSGVSRIYNVNQGGVEPPTS